MDSRCHRFASHDGGAHLWLRLGILSVPARSNAQSRRRFDIVAQTDCTGGQRAVGTMPIASLERATNDGHGRLDLAYRTIDLLPKDAGRQLLTAKLRSPRRGPREASSLPLWINGNLKAGGNAWPATPQLELSGNGIPRAGRCPSSLPRLITLDLLPRQRLANDPLLAERHRRAAEKWILYW